MAYMKSTNFSSFISIEMVLHSRLFVDAAGDAGKLLLLLLQVGQHGVVFVYFGIEGVFGLFGGCCLGVFVLSLGVEVGDGGGV